MEEKLREQRLRRAPRLTKPPKLVHQVPPVFPDSARAEGRQGTVMLRITIDEEGYVQRVDVLQSAGEDLDHAAMGAVGNFVFEPAEVDDVPSPIQIDYRQTFVLKAEVKEVPVEPLPVEALPGAESAPASQPGETAPVEEEPEVEDTRPVNFLGLVRESGTKAPLQDVEIYVQVKGAEGEYAATTGKNGRFEVRGVPPGPHLVRVTGTGYEQMTTVEEFSEKEAVYAIYYLPRRSYNKFETIVVSKREQKEVSRISLRREEVSQVPGTFGDPVRVVENLPGMARAPVIGGALLVRGANPQDTGVYMDGVPIPLLYHFLALTSVVNAEFLETMDFFPGGFGGRFGRATAGILDVKTRDLKLRRCRGQAKVDLVDSGFFFGCPITLFGPEVDSDAPNWRRVDFAFAGRRSYLDALVPLFMNLFLPANVGALTVAPVYWDYQAKLEYRPFSAHTLTLFAFGSDDQLKLLSAGNVESDAFQIRTQQTFHRLLAAWEWRVLPRLTNRLAPWVGWELNRLSGGSGDISGLLAIDIRSMGLRDDVKYQLMEGVSLNAGVDFMAGSFSLDASFPFTAAISEFPRLLPRLEGEIALGQRGEGTNWGAYNEVELGPFLGLKVIPGVRYDVYELANKTNVSVQPRIAVRWQVMPWTVLKGAYGVYEQMPSAETRLDGIGNRDLLPERSRHHIVGVEQRLTPFLNVDMQFFFNRRDMLAVQSQRLLSVEGGVVQPEIYSNEGLGNSYGMELLVRHELTKNFFGWVAYTLSRSEVQAHPKRPWLLTQFDQTHILTIVAQYKFPWHMPFREWSRTGRLPRGLWWNSAWAILSGDWSVGGRFRAVSGNPTTTYTSAVHDLDTEEFTPRSGDLRGARLPAFHQLDVRVDYKIAFDNFLVNFYVDVLNVYNQKNAEMMIWDYRYREKEPLALLPFIPVFGMSAEF
jgi:TonB family protein